MSRYEKEIAIESVGVPYGLFNRRIEQGYLLVDGTALLESEKDAQGRYRGGAGMGGMFLSTGRLYEPVIDGGGTVRAFREAPPVNYLAAAEMGAEQNYNQIDGIINNEAPPSVREDLRRFAEESAQAAPSGQPTRGEAR